MAKKRAVDRRIVMSLFTKETSYNNGVTQNASNSCEMSEFDSAPRDFPDNIVDDTNTQNEFATQQEILQDQVVIPYSEPRTKPNSVAGLAGMALGSIASTQDGAVTAYRHKIIPALTIPSIQVDEEAGKKKFFKGVKARTFNLIGNPDGFISMNGELLGSGHRADSSLDFNTVGVISESWLKTKNANVWIETGANVSIDDPPTQGAEAISSATPDSLNVRMRSFELNWNNNNYINYGYGSGSGIIQDHDIGGRREVGFKFSLVYEDDDDILGHYLNQTVVAFDMDVDSGVLIAAGGTFNYGIRLIIPKLQIKKVTRNGNAGDYIMEDYECTVMNDGTNDVIRLYAYNAQAAYLA